MATDGAVVTEVEAPPVTIEKESPASPKELESSFPKATDSAPQSDVSQRDSAVSDHGNGVPALVFATPFQPQYPTISLLKGMRGSVTVQFKINREGAPESIEILSSAPSGVFESSVLQALEKTRVQPGSVPANSRFIVTISYDPAGINYRNGPSPPSENMPIGSLPTSP